MPGRRAEPYRANRRVPRGRTSLLRFARAGEGAAAVEFAFLAPVLLALLIGAVEIANIIFVQYNITSVARDSARRLAVDALSEADAEGFIAERLRGFTSATPSIEVAERALADGEVEVHVSITVAVADAMVSRGLLPGGDGSVDRVADAEAGRSATASATTQANGPDVGSGGGGTDGTLQLGASATMLKE